MVKRYVLLYVLVEMAVLIALTATVGLGWTLLALVAAFTLGLLLAGSQIRRQVAQLRRGLTDPGAQATDSALVALGSVLVFIPGLVTTAAGLLLLAPPSRSAVRPMATGLVTRGLTRRVAFVTPRRSYIDGEVVDMPDVHGAPVANLPVLRPRPE